jgi:hypothetical protein
MSNPLLNSRSNYASIVAAEDTLIDELPGLLSNVTFNIKGTKMTTAQVVAQLQAHQAAIATQAKAKAALHEATLAQQLLREAVQATAAAVAAYVVAVYGANSPYLATLGFAPAARQKPTLATRALAAEKSKATRQARGTKGKRQKASIHGTVSASGNAPADKR